jgi:hypothetical protein
MATPPPLLDSAADAGSAEDINLDQRKLRCYINRSAKIARSEDEFRKALLVSVVGDSTMPSVDTIMAELARRYELLVESLQVHHQSLGDYLLVLFDEAAVVWVYNVGRSLQLPPFTVVGQRWSRFMGASETAPPHLVDVKLGGISMHAWELEVEHLLVDWCWDTKLSRVGIHGQSG